MTGLRIETIDVASRTDVGRVREINQDAVASLVTRGNALLLVVADGMGGHQGGEIASRLAIDAICEAIENSVDAPEDTLRRALRAANRRIYQAAQRDARLAGMGTTGVALFIQQDASVWVANVGDSRAYRKRGEAFESLTSDHSLVAELQRRGEITEDEARVHPKRNQLLRAIGIEERVEVDISRGEVQAGDIYLLCSDGLSGVLYDSEISEILGRQGCEGASEELLRVANERGGPDNITVQIASVPKE